MSGSLKKCPVCNVNYRWRTHRGKKVPVCPKAKKHTRATYHQHKCRCEDCLAANNEYMTDLRKRLKKRLQANPKAIKHGTISGYTNYGCHCAKCTRAQRAANKITRNSS